LTYASFLIRIWRDEELPATNFQIEVEHIQTGTHQSFSTMDEFINFLQQPFPPLNCHSGEPENKDDL